ncbi:MAG TPA: hypothetical protein PKX25_13405, partial [Microthrixaceae bacterium]|nr:hypothetical protein [Microthrixaceae bacterium]
IADASRDRPRPDDTAAERPDDTAAERPDDTVAKRPDDTVAKRPDDTVAAEILLERWPSARPFVVVGAVAVVAGGAVAAVTRPTGFELGPWLAAFLVLVGGVAQIALGAGQAWVADRLPDTGTVRAELTIWNIGLAATMAGSLLPALLLTALGAVAVLIALALFLSATRPHHDAAAAVAPRWARILYPLGIVVVLISTPIGLVLSWTRHG